MVAVWARNAGVTADASQGLAQVPYVINGSAAPLSVTSLTSNLSSPQGSGTTITFTAAATGGTAPYQFKWWVQSGNTWTIAQDWSSSATLTWRPLVSGAYSVAVWARNAGVTSDASQAMSQVNYAITPGAPTNPLVLGLTGNVTSPQILGASITFTASATGGTPPHQFKWWVYDGGQWNIARDWATGSTFTWQPTRPGTYLVAAWVRNAGVTTDASQAMAQTSYVITTASGIPPAITSFTSSVASPTTTGTTVTFNTTVAGGLGPHQFKWWVFSNGDWSIAQEWSNSSTLAWRPTRPGSYIVAVWVRNAGVSEDASQAMTQVQYIVTP
jgi:hypothetical protein